MLNLQLKFLLLCKQDAIYGRECRAAANAMLKVLQRMQKIHVRFFYYDISQNLLYENFINSDISFFRLLLLLGRDLEKGMIQILASQMHLSLLEAAIMILYVLLLEVPTSPLFLFCSLVHTYLKGNMLFYLRSCNDEIHYCSTRNRDIQGSSSFSGTTKTQCSLQKGMAFKYLCTWLNLSP